jgi:hypothetical protein
VREQGWIRLAGDGEKAAAISLILAPLLLRKPTQPLLAGVLLQKKFSCFITFIQDSGAGPEEEHCNALTHFQDQYANTYTQVMTQ